MNGRITIDPSIRHGKPVVRGTRVPVHRIIGSLAGGATPEEVCEEYGIVDADVRAALEYAEELVEAEEAHPHRRRSSSLRSRRDRRIRSRVG